MRRSGYGSYRGRTRFHTFLKVLIAVLFVVLIFGVVAFFLLEKYMVYSEDGVRLVLPFWTQQTQPQTPPSVPSATAPVLVTTPDPIPTPTPEPPLQAVLLPREALYDGSAERRVAEAGASAALFDMKADEGSLGYISALELAISAQTSASDVALNGAIKGLNDGDLYTVARVSCFRDNTVPRYRTALAVRSPGGNWRDAGGLRWLSPTSQEAQAYVIGVCRELAELGFDEILLDNSGYPVNGKLSNIRVGEAYDRTRLEPVIAEFYRQLRQELADWPEMKLSIVGTEASIRSEEDVDSGQSRAALLEYADHIWLPTPTAEGGDYEQALAAAGAEDSADKIVLIGQTPGLQSQAWAVLPAQ